ncbi:ABC transporter permease [Erwinia tracheiphila]|uniref:Iron ABC transporter permease n=1 Tax=Erwinia tracheiphila TaxID=65700 RepID=A0A0M2KFC8_9GAMM|nr:binding-protein-dependent transport systems inner membrane component [Erwinia tracheiphila PSU-1]KKF36052.1 iron ABC transporter permease [Erwinia tracheiphila]
MPHPAVTTPPFGGVSARSPGLFVLMLAAVITVFSLLPLAFVARITFSSGWETIRTLLLRPRVAELFLNTTLLILCTLPLNLLAGIGLAWLTERTTLPGRRAWSLLCTAPLGVPAFIQSYAWISALPAISGLGAAVFLSLLAYFPFIYLPAAAVLRRLDPELEYVAASLGQPPLAIFFRVILPQMKLAILGGVLLTVLHLLAEYGLFALIRFDSFTTAIFDQFQSTFNGPAANMLAGVLAITCLLFLLLDIKVRGRARHTRVGGGVPQQRQPKTLSSGQVLLFSLLPLTLVLLSLGVPLLVLLRWLWAGGLTVWQQPALWQALQQTVLLALAGAALTTASAFPLAWLSVRYPQRVFRLMESSNYLTGSLPGLVIALALVTFTLQIAPPLYQTAFTLLLAYVLLYLPRALVNLRAGIAQTPAELENVAASMGKTPAQVLWRVTLRLAAPAAASGAVLTFIGIASELTATLLLSPLGTRTLATGFWSLTSEIDYVAASPYALLLILLSLPLTSLLYRQADRAAGI